jgi:dinuclear metal center YbgI/SA1388 family protein
MQISQPAMLLGDLCETLENWAPPALQEGYDNSGLLVGDKKMPVSGVLVSLDLTEDVMNEALARGCNVIVSHHPIIFGGLKRLEGTNYVQRCVIRAIKSDLALYAIHTNLDHLAAGVSRRLARAIGLEGGKVLQPKAGVLRTLVTFVPHSHVEAVRAALFAAGAGDLGKYSQASFGSEGVGTFLPAADAKPHLGTPGSLHYEKEVRLEVLYEHWKEAKLLDALFAAHPYEEVAYYLLQMQNRTADYGAGWIAEWPQPKSPAEALQHLKNTLGGVIRHTALPSDPIQKVAVCGGSGSFLLPDALAAGAQMLVTADFKYHQFFDADKRIVIADVGHFESEQFTSDLIATYLKEKFTNFAVLISETNTNPVNYF